MATMAILSALLTTGCSVVGIRSGTEEPSYTVVQTLGRLEVRDYPPRLVAETIVPGDAFAARSSGFQRLARFIFGGNQAGSNIAMTAPVGQDQLPPGEWRISFVMPKKYTPSSLPQPSDPAVQIVTAPEQTVAVYRYTGSIDPAATASAERELLRLLQGSSWIAAGQPVTWFYDPPWTIPFLRRNEAAVPVAKPD